MASKEETRKTGVLTRPQVGGAHEHETELRDPLFFCNNTPVVGSPETPGRVAPDISFEMHFFSDKKVMPDGEEVEIWGFEDVLRSKDDKTLRKPFPSSLIRVREGQIVHVKVKPGKRQHTIHLHGIESDTHNDGVGHTSFEVTGSYTYQWRAGAPFGSHGRGAGTYFYHCHVNTTLHFEMGMYGSLIVDPVEGPGTAFQGGPTYDVEAERIWAVDDIDPRWHELPHAAGLCGGDAGLNDFRPEYFLITGVPQPLTGTITDPRVATHGKLGGEPILIRYINAGYTRQRITFEGLGDGLDVEVIASDGRGFDNRPPNFAKPFLLEKGKPPEVATAERYDYLVKPKKRGVYPVTVEFLHWIRGDVIGVVTTTITIS